MPILNDDIRQTKTHKLSEPQGGEIEFYTSYLVRDIETISKTENVGKILPTIKSLIKDWNLTNEKGEKLPVSEENISRLNMLDIIEIYNDESLKGFLKKAQEMNGGNKTK